MVTCILKKNKKEGGSHDEGFPHEQRGLGTRLNKGKQFFFLQDIWSLQ